jgi:hypothetical protein
MYQLKKWIKVLSPWSIEFFSAKIPMLYKLNNWWDAVTEAIPCREPKEPIMRRNQVENSDSQKDDFIFL